MRNSRRSYRSNVACRRFLPSIAVFSLLGFAGLTPLGAGVSLDVVPSFPPTVTAAATGLSASLAFSNSSTGPDAAFSISITAIALTPSCGNASTICSEPDPGVFALSATGTGQAGSACAGAVFTIGAPDAGGRATFSPSPPVVLAPTGQPGSSCTVLFTFGVLKVPTIDASNPIPGVQTDPLGQVSGVTIGNPGSTDSNGETELTVERALPTLATSASAAVFLGGAVSDTAQLAAGSNPGGGNVTFHLYGPNDATCSQPQVFVSTNTATAGGAATSNPFTPTAPGTYRWIAAYAGDANNLPVQGACNDANESVLVSLSPPSIAVLPVSLAAALPVGGTETQPLDIENQGQSDLDWTIGEASQAGTVGSRHVWRYDSGLTHEGFGVPISAGNRLADDFIVPAGAPRTIDTITFFVYVSDSATATDLRVQIWDGPPGAAGSTVVFGDRETDRLASSTFTDVSRIADTDLQVSTGPILALVATIDTTLAPGRYWLDGSADGTLERELAFRIEGTFAPCDTPTNLPWVSVGQTAGTTAGGATTAVNVNFDAIGLARGLYSGVLCVHSNDLVTPLVEVPVTLAVAVIFVDGFETSNTSRWSFAAP